MRIAAHITFFYFEHRLSYLKETIANLQTLKADVAIYIYCNKAFDIDDFGKNVFLKIFKYTPKGTKPYRNIKSRFANFLNIKNNIHPFHLAWESRNIIYKKRNIFDAQIYIEDDITFNEKNFEYWLNYKDLFIKNNYNLGFLRYEVDDDKKIFATDLLAKIENTITVNDQLCVINDNNPYCGFWIYDKAELIRFTKSKEWKFKFAAYMTREKAAIGMHGTEMNFYKNTIIPLVTNNYNKLQIHEGSLIHHIPNNYIGNEEFCKIKLPLQF